MPPPSRACSPGGRPMPDFSYLTRSREQIAADNEAELASWIDERAAQFIARGEQPEEARRLAIEEFGDLAAAERYAAGQDIAANRRARVLLWLEELGSDLRIAARGFARTPIVTGVLLLTFALGLGAPTAIFSVVHALLLRPLPYGEEATLVQLQRIELGTRKPLGRHTAAALVALRERTTSFTGIAGLEPGNFNFTGSGEPELLFGSGVTDQGFEVFGTPPALGRWIDARDMVSGGAGGVMLTDQLWRRRFGADPSVIGRMIDMSQWRMAVIGVLPPGFRVPTYEDAGFLYPRDLAGFMRQMSPRVLENMPLSRLFARLNPAITLSGAQADVDRVAVGLAKEFPQAYGGTGIRLLPIREAMAGSVRPRVLLLMAAAGFLFLITCANIAGVVLARAVARRHELSIRVALGAGRRRLVRQFLVEGFAIALLGIGVGLLVAELGIIGLRSIAVAALPAGTSFGLEPRVLLFSIGIALVGAVGASLVPALGSTRVLPVALRRENGRTTISPATRRMRLVLVAGQLAVSLVLLVGAGLLVRTLWQLAALDLGYSTARRLTFEVQFAGGRYDTNAGEDAFWTSLYDRLRAIPGVESVGGGSIPMGGYNRDIVHIEGRPEASALRFEVRYTAASHDYFRTLEIPLLRGRAFGPSDRDGAPRVCLISAGLARALWPDHDPVGARIRLEGWRVPWMTIVGVVGDVLIGSEEAPQPTVYTSQRQDLFHGGGHVVVRAAREAGTFAGAVRETVKAIDPNLPVRGLRTLDDMWRDLPAIANRRLPMQLLLVFAALALAISAIGVYGVSAYAAESRQREFGIRLALGASRRRVLWLALRDGATVAGYGALAGVPLALMLASRMRVLLYQATPLDPLVLSAGLGSLILIVSIAGLIPALHATSIDPASTLKGE